MAEILAFFMIGWDDWIKKRVNYLNCIDRRVVGMKDLKYIAQNIALFISSIIKLLIIENFEGIN